MTKKSKKSIREPLGRREANRWKAAMKHSWDWIESACYALDIEPPTDTEIIDTEIVGDNKLSKFPKTFKNELPQLDQALNDLKQLVEDGKIIERGRKVHSVELDDERRDELREEGIKIDKELRVSTPGRLDPEEVIDQMARKGYPALGYDKYAMPKLKDKPKPYLLPDEYLDTLAPERLKANGDGQDAIFKWIPNGEAVEILQNAMNYPNKQTAQSVLSRAKNKRRLTSRINRGKRLVELRSLMDLIDEIKANQRKQGNRIDSDYEIG